MKPIATLIAFLISANLYAQSAEVFVGASSNSFFGNSNGVFTAYTPGKGHTIKFALNGKKNKIFTWRVTIGYDRYGGEFKNLFNGFSGKTLICGKIDKAALSLGIFPLNFRFWDKIDLNFGIEFAKNFRDGFEGTETVTTFNGISTTSDLKKSYSSFNTNFNSGLSSRIAYDIKIADNLYLSPQYAFYLGMTSEFIENPRRTKSLRHYFGLGLEWKI